MHKSAVAALMLVAVCLCHVRARQIEAGNEEESSLDNADVTIEDVDVQGDKIENLKSFNISALVDATASKNDGTTDKSGDLSTFSFLTTTLAPLTSFLFGYPSPSDRENSDDADNAADTITTAGLLPNDLPEDVERQENLPVDTRHEDDVETLLGSLVPGHGDTLPPVSSSPADNTSYEMESLPSNPRPLDDSTRSTSTTHDVSPAHDGKVPSTKHKTSKLWTPLSKLGKKGKKHKHGAKPLLSNEVLLGYEKGLPSNVSELFASDSRQYPSNGPNLGDLARYMKTCDDCLTTEEDYQCPLHDSAVGLKNWMSELDALINNGCQNKDGCPAGSKKCCHSNNPALERALTEMTTMVRDMYRIFQDACSNCPRDGGWTPWFEPSPCSVSCGQGVRTRTRECTNPTPKGGGKDCPGEMMSTEPCKGPECCTDGNWSMWSPWGSCSATCGSGMKTRSRRCSNPPPNDCGRTCPGSPEDMAPCDTGRDCCRPRDGNWASWTSWSACTVTCGGGGSRERSRVCSNPSPNECGQSCRGSDYETQPCGYDDCCVNGSWSSWLSWGSCSVTCDTGVRSRMRRCDNPPPNFCGLRCPGSADESQQCYGGKPCCVDGNWGPWAPWSRPSQTCGMETRDRRRLCDNPSPNYCGAQCPGRDFETDSFLVAPCPIIKCVDGNWGSWESWSQPSVTCGTGSRSRQRRCDNPMPNFCGKPCPGDSTQTQTYDTGNPCCVDGNWGSWESWSQPSVTCGTGSRSRRRRCDNPMPNICGQTCPGDSIQTQTYDTGFPCCVNGNWGSWESWSQASVTCGTGSRSRRRRCDNPMPNYCGDTCPGDSIQTQTYDSGIPCCVNGNWGSWESWSQASVTCGTGSRSRRRRCDNPMPNFCGQTCPGNITQTQTYDTGIPCCVDGNWGSWFSWSRPTASCGLGTKERRRPCNNPSPNNCGRPCPGPEVERQEEDTGIPCAPVCKCGHRQVDLIFVLDASTSVTEENFNVMKDFLKFFLYNARIDEGDVRVGLITFSDKEKAEFHLNAFTSRLAMFDAIDSTPWIHGNTNTAAALRTMRAEMFTFRHGDRLSVENVAVVMTDGVSNINNSQTIPEADRARMAGIHIYAIGIGLGQDIQELDGIANKPTSLNRFTVDEFKELKGLRDSLLSALCRTAINGDWSVWSPWSPCSVTCGRGVRERSRSCSNPAPNECGDPCPEGPTRETQRCEEVTVNGNWSPWTPWYDCSVTCGVGVKRRERSCDNPPANRCGLPCPGSDQDMERCELRGCCVNGNWGQWAPWSRPSVTCGIGSRQRRRLCNNPSPNYCGDPCPGSGEEVEEVNTNRACEVCVDGNWGQWTFWSQPSETCGTGTRERRRRCDNPSRNYCGAPCPGSDSQTDVVNLGVPCPPPCVDGNWGQWATWSRPSVTCGTGTRERRRLCNNPSPNYCGDPCPGSGVETAVYNTDVPCEVCVDGNWGQWTFWSQPSETCGSGTRERRRRCDNPSRNYCGAQCPGSDRQTDVVNLGIPCAPLCVAVNGNWGMWGSWSPCGVTCGMSQRQRRRSCDSPEPNSCGESCPGLGTESQTYRCGPDAIDGQWGTWGSWGECSVSCGRGQVLRRRVCNNPPASLCGQPCPGPETDSRPCENPCPCVPRQWSTWGPWSRCGVTCGAGTRSRQRNCQSRASYWQEDCPDRCPGEATDVANCPDQPPCEGPWTDWSPCSVTCAGFGVRQRRRQGSSSFFDLTGTKVEEEFCQVFSPPCPEWGPWGACSVTCAGVGRRERRLLGAEASGGDIIGRQFEVEDCIVNTPPCPTWGPWGACSATCAGAGYRERRLLGREAAAGDLIGRQVEVEECTTFSPPCPPKASWGSWEDWCPCDCKRGIISRRRVCEELDEAGRPRPADFSLCGAGDARETQPCDIRKHCPVCVSDCRGRADDNYPSCSSCQDYLYCRSGQSQVFTCKNNYEWDAFIRKCVVPPSPSCALAKCVTSCDNLEDGRYPSCQGCTSYLECQRGRVLQMRCYGGEEFNALTEKCEPGRSPTCVRTVPDDVDFQRDAPADSYFTTSELDPDKQRELYLELSKQAGVAALFNRSDDDVMKEWELYHNNTLSKSTSTTTQDNNAGGSDDRNDSTAAANHDAIKKKAKDAEARKEARPAGIPRHSKKKDQRVNQDLAGSKDKFTCLSDCDTAVEGFYQSCKSCQHYLECQPGNVGRHHRCAKNRFWDDQAKKCKKTSSTCHPDTLSSFISARNNNNV